MRVIWTLTLSFPLAVVVACDDPGGRAPPAGTQPPPADCLAYGAIPPTANTATIAYGLEKTGAFSRPAVWVFHAEAGDAIEATITPTDPAHHGTLALYAPPEVNRSNPGAPLSRGVDETSGVVVTRLRFSANVAGLHTLVARGCTTSMASDVYRLKLLCTGGGCAGANCSNACTGGTTRCAGTFMETCTQQLAGCAGWVVSNDCAAGGLACVGGRCESPCGNECQPNQKRCVGSSIEQCTRSAAGCYSWSTVDVCVGAMRCDQGVCVPQDQSRCEYPNMLIVLDRSSSMDEPMTGISSKKIDGAKSAIRSIVSARQNAISFGLMTFNGAGACTGPQLLVDVAPNNYTAINASLDAISAGGDTPIVAALEGAGQVQSLRAGGRRSFVVLVTDGQETCISGNRRDLSVQAVQALAAQGIKTFVIGFGSGFMGISSTDPVALNRMAVAGGTARPNCNQSSTNASAPDNCYYQANDGTALIAALDAIGRNIGTEICDGLDNDCNNKIDEGLKRSCQTDCGVGEEICVYGQWVNCNAPLRDDKGNCRGGAPDAG